RPEAPHQPGNLIGGQPSLRIDQIPRQLRTIGPYHTSLAPHIASCVRHVPASRIDPSPRESQLPRQRSDFFTSSSAGMTRVVRNALPTGVVPAEAGTQDTVQRGFVVDGARSVTQDAPAVIVSENSSCP